MRRPARCSQCLIAVACCVLSGCASTHLRPVTHSDFVPESDERQLWSQSTWLDDYFQKHDLVYNDEQLDNYLNGVATRLLLHLRAQQVPVRVRVIESPFLNAFALPNGSVYVYTGMLAQMDNEAELATVLAHELTHFIERHGLKELRTAENRQATTRAILGVLAVVAAGITADPGAARTLLDLSGSLADTLVAVQVSGYSRDLEREADARGLRAMAEAGYDPRDAPKLFAQLQREAAEAGVKEPYFFGSHPRLEERIENCDEFLAEWKASPGRPETPRVGTDDFETAVSGVLLENAKLDERLSRFDRARDAIERHLAHRPDSVPGHFALGELDRQNGDDPAHLEKAAKQYRETLRLDPKFAPAHRELGLLYRRQGLIEPAREELARYIALAPEATDRPIIEGYVSDLPTAKR